MISRLQGSNPYTLIQKIEYIRGTSDHEEHNANTDLFRLILEPLVLDAMSFSSPRVLDFGCGKGRNIQNLLDLGFEGELWGADISRANIVACKKRFPKISRQFLKTNGTDLGELKSENFTAVFSTIVFQHIPVWSIRNQLLSEINRVLITRGRLYLQMGFGKELVTSEGSPLAKYTEEKKDALGSNGSLDVQIRSREELISHLSNLGFQVSKVEITPSFSDKQHSSWIFVVAEKL